MKASTLHELLPATLRTRDLELAGKIAELLSTAERLELAALQALSAPTPEERTRTAELLDKLTFGPLKTVLGVLAEPLAAFEENLAQLYDDLFVETCAPWVLPYIGDLVGYRTLHDTNQPAARRAELAHTIALRRRKGTASMLEQLARDVTGWNARAVEFFQLLTVASYMNHVRNDRGTTADIRHAARAERCGTAFDSYAHAIDVRRIASGRGRFNIPNVGLFLFPFDAQPLRRSPAVASGAGGLRFWVDPLGISRPLVTLPESEEEIAHLAEPRNTPLPISRRMLHDDLVGKDLNVVPSDYYGPERSIAIYRGGVLVPPADIEVRHLGDNGATWGLQAPAADRIAIDPVLGRILLGTPLVRESLEVTFHYAAPMHLGGGEYERTESFSSPEDARMERVSAHGLPGTHANIQAAIAALDAGGVGGIVEVLDSSRYEIPAASSLLLDAPAHRQIELRAANECRPTLVLERPIEARGGAGSKVHINGFLMTGRRGQALVDGGNPFTGAVIHVPASARNALVELSISHCTLVPGRSLDAAGEAEHPDEPSVLIERGSMKLTVTRTVSGGVRTAESTEAALKDSVLDAVTPERVAYADPAGASGGALTATECTIRGGVLTQRVDLLSNCICLSRVTAIRRQEGCVRFSFVTLDSRVPRRYRCQPNEGSPPVAPRFASLRFGSALYAWLSPAAPPEILKGAADEGEMGAHHAVFRPQREANLRIRLEEYLRAGLESGVFHETSGLDPEGEQT